MAVFFAPKFPRSQATSLFEYVKAESMIVLFLPSCYTCFIKVYEQLMTSYENEISCLFCSES